MLVKSYVSDVYWATQAVSDLNSKSTVLSDVLNEVLNFQPL